VRTGGNVVLTRLSEAVERVQHGADLVASELALARLRNELKSAEAALADAQESREHATRIRTRDSAEWYIAQESRRSTRRFLFGVIGIPLAAVGIFLLVVHVYFLVDGIAQGEIARQSSEVAAKIWATFLILFLVEGLLAFFGIKLIWKMWKYPQIRPSEEQLKSWGPVLDSAVVDAERRVSEIRAQIEKRERIVRS
jgi:hypothetical protein